MISQSFFIINKPLHCVTARGFASVQEKQIRHLEVSEGNGQSQVSVIGYIAYAL